MNLPLIIVNFKAFEQGTGANAVKLAKIHQRVVEETGANIAIAVNSLDLAAVCNSVKIPVFAQHLDYVDYGSHTGHFVAEHVKEVGAFGTLLNHAEYPLEGETIKRAVQRARAAGLFTVVCANTPERAREVAKYDVDMVAVEPPELIGGAVSVSKANPEIIEQAVALVGSGRLLVGAGIKTADDVRIALSLGASGVLLASGVVKSDDPYSVLLDLVSGLK
ncbi:MAG: triose-phosphate isomerase [Patescibacteria group bacterium]